MATLFGVPRGALTDADIYTIDFVSPGVSEPGDHGREHGNAPE